MKCVRVDALCVNGAYNGTTSMFVVHCSVTVTFVLDVIYDN